MTVQKTVLIIDDDESHLLTAKGIIEGLGFRVVMHNSPFRTTETVLKTKPDMLLIDVNMPALPGDQLCSLLRDEPELTSLPIYLYSSNDEDILRESAVKYQADGYICKGSISALRAKVQFELGFS
ncbi:CheY chemotaxis protein or a CheY-like REC (receiver) domain [Malonomonas rubra DSM 5091]|uniref:CheY chemotaxis protein or a CheY-like REC (Receiver) domain n=1 Tax=Malonomonas rubra DSM 5091 TaxID=1122189 RepID=A0A1M6H5C2_MALRU|nr:response regulator [Malonomonas rubra]SHJ17457.1 CheY chemotaxis protein or a CheY-like REC (receiver) domain [Malonomonas rubra DSM 5091]